MIFVTFVHLYICTSNFFVNFFSHFVRREKSRIEF